jgi:DNA-binding GntR family transcriptional regulator
LSTQTTDGAAARVVAELEEEIRAGRLTPGQRLTEAELTRRLGVSRGPVREALARLQSHGLVEIEPHRGASVRRMSRREMQELFDVRALLAAEGARLAALRIDEADNAARLRAALAEQERLHADPALERYADANVSFHALLDDLSGNATLATLLDRLQTRSGIFLGLAQNRRREAFVDQHIAVAEAVLAGDGRAAARLMRRHVADTAAIVLSLPDSWFV